VIVFQKPSVSAGINGSVSLGSTIKLEAIGKDIVSWMWTPGVTLSDSTIYNPAASPLITTVYKVTGTDLNGCINSDTMTVFVLVDYKITPTNVITPNGDGYNDTWYIDNIQNYPNTKVIILNREGMEVYTSDSYDNMWDGTFNGKKLADGTYYYVIQFKNDPKVYKGAITVLNGDGVGQKQN
jgi:gliding motility-associated-like protein